MRGGFNRGLSCSFIDKLRAEAAKKGWWFDVLRDQDLLIGVREEYLDVDHLGQRIFHVRASASGLIVSTHPKYLVNPDIAEPVKLIGVDFSTESLRKNGFISRYEDKETLQRMKRAAAYFSGLEKTGCHLIALQNPNIIDYEIAFTRVSPAGPGPGAGPQFMDEVPALLDDIADAEPSARSATGPPRADLAALMAHGEEVTLVFWEAKHYSNKELRASGDRTPLVCGQVSRYRNYLAENRDAVEASYNKVAKNLSTISEMGWGRQLSPLIAEVANGNRRLVLGAEPQVGLLIFGFDRGQREEASWKDTHLPKLKAAVRGERVLSIGDAKRVRLLS